MSTIDQTNHSFQALSSVHDTEVGLDSHIAQKRAFSSYLFVTERLTGRQQQMLDAELIRYSSLSDYVEKMNLALEIIESNDILNHFLFDPSFDYFALIALKDGIITLEQFCSIMMAKAGIANCIHDVEVVDLFIGESINPRAYQLIQETNDNPLAEKLYEEEEIGLLTSSQIDEFFEKMRRAPKSEQKLYLIPMAEKQLEDAYSLANALYYKGKFNLFQFLPSTQQRIIPSFTMMQTALDVSAVSSQTPIQIHPVIGTSSTQDIYQGLKDHQRDMMIPMSGFAMPDVADGYVVVDDLDFIMHDFYHLVILNYVPEKHRQAFYYLATLVAQYASSDECSLSEEEIEAVKGLIFSTIADMEFNNYRPDEKKLLSENKIFGQIIDSLIRTSAFKGIRQEFLHSKEAVYELDKEALEEPTEVALELLAQSGIAKALGQILSEKNEYFAQQFNLDLDECFSGIELIDSPIIQSYNEQIFAR